jgi:hypothetical protein
MKKLLFILLLITLPVWGQKKRDTLYTKEQALEFATQQGYVKSVDWSNPQATFMPSYGMKVKLDSNWNIAIANCLLNLLKEYKEDNDKQIKELKNIWATDIVHGFSPDLDMLKEEIKKLEPTFIGFISWLERRVKR